MLFGPYHSRNLGDTAIQMSVMQNLLVRRPEFQVIGASLNPADTTRSLGIPAFPVSGRGPDTLSANEGKTAAVATRDTEKANGLLARIKAIRRIAAFARGVDLLVVSGGGQLDDFWGGAWGHPFSLFVWVGLARLHGARIAIAGIGLDRLSNPLSRFFVLSAIRLAHYRTFRDAGTQAALKELGLRSASGLCPDLAFSLQGNVISVLHDQKRDSFVVISPISATTWTHKSDERHEKYLLHLVAACVWLSNRGLRLRIVCSQAAMDGATARRLVSILHDEYSISADIGDAATVVDFLAQVRDARVVVASRLHAAILSLVAGVPVVAVAPQRKVTQLMDDAGLAEYCIDLKAVTADDLIPRIANALDNERRLRAHVRECTNRFRYTLVKTFDEIAALA